MVAVASLPRSPRLRARPRLYLKPTLLAALLALIILASVSFLHYLGLEPPRFLGYAPPHTYQAGQVIHYPDGQIFLIVDDPTRRDGFRAFKDTDPRNGCPLRWDERQRLLYDICHSSMYDEHGRIRSGPAPRPLQPLRIQVDGIVSVERPPVTPPLRRFFPPDYLPARRAP